MSKDPGNPTTTAEHDRYIKVLDRLTADAREIERTIAADQLAELKSERDAERERWKLVAQQCVVRFLVNFGCFVGLFGC